MRANVSCQEGCRNAVIKYAGVLHKYLQVHKCTSAVLVSAKHAKHASSVDSRPVDRLHFHLLLLLALSLKQSPDPIGSARMKTLPEMRCWPKTMENDISGRKTFSVDEKMYKPGAITLFSTQSSSNIPSPQKCT